MPRRRVARPKRMTGYGIFDSVWSGIKKAANVVAPVIKPIHGVVKDSGLVSTGLAMVNPAAGGVAKALGYGRRRKTTGGRKKKVVGGRKMKGGSAGMLPVMIF